MRWFIVYKPGRILCWPNGFNSKRQANRLIDRLGMRDKLHVVLSKIDQPVTIDTV